MWLKLKQELGVLSNFGLTFYKEDIIEVTVVACFISQEREK